MNFNSVFARMAEDLAIKRGITENALSWKCRIAYSVTAKRGLDALWEKDEQAQHGTVSLSHLIETMKQVFRVFYVLCPDIEASIQSFVQQPTCSRNEPEALLVKLLQQGGCFYHTSYRAAPSPFVKAQLAGVTFLRGLPLGAARSMSGAGMYMRIPAEGSPEAVASLFGLRKILSETELDRLEKALPEESRESMDGWEFLELTRTNGKYWKSCPDKGVSSLARRVHDVEKAYALYRYDGRTFLCRPLPEFWHSGTQYLALAIALLTRRGMLPPITYNVNNNDSVVSLKMGYLLPPAEETFFRLYSWPDMVQNKNPYFFRIMARPVFEAFQILMTHLGYTFLEESHG